MSPAAGGVHAGKDKVFGAVVAEGGFVPELDDGEGGEDVEVKGRRRRGERGDGGRIGRAAKWGLADSLQGFRYWCYISVWDGIEPHETIHVYSQSLDVSLTWDYVRKTDDDNGAIGYILSLAKLAVFIEYRK